MALIKYWNRKTAECYTQVIIEIVKKMQELLEKLFVSRQQQINLNVLILISMYNLSII